MASPDSSRWWMCPERTFWVCIVSRDRDRKKLWLGRRRRRRRQLRRPCGCPVPVRGGLCVRMGMDAYGSRCILVGGARPGRPRAQPEAGMRCVAFQVGPLSRRPRWRRSWPRAREGLPFRAVGRRRAVVSRDSCALLDGPGRVWSARPVWAFRGSLSQFESV